MGCGGKWSISNTILTRTVFDSDRSPAELPNSAQNCRLALFPSNPRMPVHDFTIHHNPFKLHKTAPKTTQEY